LIIRYRDIRHLVPFLLLLGMFVTPIVYPFALVPDAVQPFYALNPMVGILELYRWCLFGTLAAAAWIVMIPLATAAILIVTGLRFFRRAELSFADVI
jgi:lipopolysaccharide transport system permease protein